MPAMQSNWTFLSLHYAGSGSLLPEPFFFTSSNSFVTTSCIYFCKISIRLSFAEYSFPKISCIISIWIRITFATYFSGAITSLIKWQEISVCALKSCSHKNIGKVYSEMYQYPFLKGKNRILTGTIKLILINRICCILSCKLTFGV